MRELPVIRGKDAQDFLQREKEAEARLKERSDRIMSLYDEKVTLVLTKSQLAIVLDCLEVSETEDGVMEVYTEINNQAKNQK
jgi:hypothetical protein